MIFFYSRQRKNLLSMLLSSLITDSNDIADITIQASAAALKLDIHLYQNNSSAIQMIKESGEQACKSVHIKYIHNIRYPLGNHCYALVFTSRPGSSLYFVTSSESNDTSTS